MLLSAESEWWNIEKFFILRCLDLFCDSPQGRDGETDYPPMVLDSLPQLRRIHISLMNRLVCDDRFSIFCNTFIRTSYILTIHPSPKVMVDFSRHKISTWCLHPISTMFGRFIKCMLVVIFSEKYMDFWYWRVVDRGLKATFGIFSQLSLNIFDNFIKRNLTDLDKILET